MATIPTPEECAMRILLELYYKNDKRSGDGYNKGYFMGLIGKGWRNDDLNNGLTLCIEKGWLEENKKRFIYPN